MEPKNRLFLDTSFAIALASRRDQHHDQAVVLASQIRENGSELVTTIPVVIEIGNSLAKQSFRSAAIQLITSLHSDSSVTIVPLDHSLYNRSFSLFSERNDKDWGLTDCISFVVMEDQDIRSALTADKHFQQAGFETLLEN
jgi:predicted nucleic acid-binding protein